MSWVCWSLSVSNAGIAIPGLIEGAFLIQRARLSGEFWMTPPPKVGRRVMFVRFGPTVPDAFGTPLRVWHDGHAPLANNCLPASGLPGTFGAGVSMIVGRPPSVGTRGVGDGLGPPCEHAARANATKPSTLTATSP